MDLRKACTASALALLTAVTMSSPAAAIVSQKQLNVPNVMQLGNEWCWAANSVTILRYYGINQSQCGFVAYAKSGTLNEACDDVGGWASESRTGLNYFGVTSTQYTGTLSYGTIKTEINSSRPIYAEIAWLGPNDAVTGRHVQTIDGYYNDTNYGVTDVTYVESTQNQHYSEDYNFFTYDAGPAGRKWEAGLWKFAKKP